MTTTRYGNGQQVCTVASGNPAANEKGGNAKTVTNFRVTDFFTSSQRHHIMLFCKCLGRDVLQGERSGPRSEVRVSAVRRNGRK